MTDATKLAQLAKDLGLTEAQRVFAEGVASGKTQRQAATDAGSNAPDSVGSRWSSSAKVQKYLEALNEGALKAATKSTSSALRTKAKLIEQLWEEAEETRAAETTWLRDESGKLVEHIRKMKPQAARISLLGFYQAQDDQGKAPVSPIQINILGIMKDEDVRNAIIGAARNHRLESGPSGDGEQPRSDV